MIYIKPPTETIEYPDNGGLGGAYMDRKHADKLYEHTRNLPGDIYTAYKYLVAVLGGFAPDASTYIVCVTNELQEAVDAWEAWSKVTPTMVAIQDRDTGFCVEPYGYG